MTTDQTIYPKLSVVICTHNPQAESFNQTLETFKQQTLDRKDWQLIVIDNQSAPALTDRRDLQWPEGTQIVAEKNLGIIHARHRGFQVARADVVVFVDDDNLIAPDYLASAYQLCQDYPEVGIWSAHIEPLFEVRPEKGMDFYFSYLAIREVENQEKSNTYFPKATTLPCGAGMVVRRQVLERYFEDVFKDPIRSQLGRRGSNLLAAEDTDIGMTACDIGYEAGLSPKLQMKHFIPRKRLERQYLNRIVEAVQYSFTRLDVARKLRKPELGTLLKLNWDILRTYGHRDPFQEFVRYRLKGRFNALFDSFISQISRRAFVRRYEVLS